MDQPPYSYIHPTHHISYRSDAVKSPPQRHLSLLSTSKKPSPYTHSRHPLCGRPHVLWQRTPRLRVRRFLHHCLIIYPGISHATRPPPHRYILQYKIARKAKSVHGTSVYRDVFRRIWPIRAVCDVEDTGLVFQYCRHV